MKWKLNFKNETKIKTELKDTNQIKIIKHWLLIKNSINIEKLKIIGMPGIKGDIILLEISHLNVLKHN